MTRIPNPFPRPRPSAPAGDANRSDQPISDPHVPDPSISGEAVKGEAVSDTASSHRADRAEYPSYSERDWRRRLIRRPTRHIPESATGLPDEVMGYLVESALAETLDALSLSPLERAVAEMRLAGVSVRDIAEETGLKKWRIERALKVVRRRLTAARHAALPDAPAGPVRCAAGWQEVYLAETRRRGKK